MSTPSTSCVEDNEVVIVVQSWVLQLEVEPGRVEKDRVQHDDNRFIGIKSTDCSGRTIRAIPKACIIVVARYKVDVGHFKEGRALVINSL